MISGVIIDGEHHTQLIGIVIRATEDSKGYQFLFQHVIRIIGDRKITIISDMAKCIKKACRMVFGNSCVLMYCFIHIKENYLKNNFFKPSIKLWNHFEDFCRSEILYDDFQKLWIDKESEVNVECKGLLFLLKNAIHFAPHKECPCHRRGIIGGPKSPDPTPFSRHLPDP